MMDLSEQQAEEQRRAYKWAHTAEDAAHAVYWQLWESIRKASHDRLIDKDEVLNAVWRKLTLDSLRARRKPEELFNDLLHILTEWKRANG